MIFRDYDEKISNELDTYLMRGFSLDADMFPESVIVPQSNESTTTTTKLYEDGVFYAYER